MLLDEISHSRFPVERDAEFKKAGRSQAGGRGKQEQEQQESVNTVCTDRETRHENYLTARYAVKRKFLTCVLWLPARFCSPQ